MKVQDDELIEVQHERLQSEDQLESWIAKNPRNFGLDLLIIGRQVPTDFNGRIDLIGIDRTGGLTILELKRDRTPRDIVGQILDYASWVRSLSTLQVHQIALGYLRFPLMEAFRREFGVPLPDSLNSAHSMIIAASEFDSSSKRIVEYLAEEHGIAINTTFFTVFRSGADLLVATDWLMDQEEVQERTESRTQAPWSGFWYVNALEDDCRSWEDMRRYGFVSAGGGRRWSDPLRKLEPGNQFFAYQKGAGFVGYGVVMESVAPITGVLFDGQVLLEEPLVNPNLGHDRDDADRMEYAVRVTWKRALPISEAKTFPGIFANQNVVCRLRDQRTLDFLKDEFGVEN